MSTVGIDIYIYLTSESLFLSQLALNLYNTYTTLAQWMLPGYIINVQLRQPTTP
jgi:hypothetical protein